MSTLEVDHIVSNDIDVDAALAAVALLSENIPELEQSIAEQMLSYFEPDFDFASGDELLITTSFNQRDKAEEQKVDYSDLQAEI